MPIDEVTNEERLDISGRLMRAQWHFEELRDEARRTKAQRLGETFGGMQERVTRYDLDEAERFLTQHGFGRDTTKRSISATDEWQDEWTSVDEALPAIPEGADSVKVSVKLPTDETPLDAFYLRKVGTLSTPGSGFALKVPILDIDNRVIGTASSSPLAPTHWRLRYE